MKAYENYVFWLRMGGNKPTVYIHNKTDDKELSSLFDGLTPKEFMQTFDDDQAHIIRMGAKTVIYKTGDYVFCVPATAKAVVNEEGKLSIYFDYPCKMEAKDLERY